MIKKDAKGNDVYKRRNIVQKRVKKERTDSYYERKKRALSERAKRLSDEDKHAEEKRHNKFKNMFSDFASNYAKTL